MTSQAIRDAIDNQAVAILDYRTSVLDLAEYILHNWSFDLYQRKPRPALLENGVLEPTDLDLSTFMLALVERGAVINLPYYESRRPKSSRVGERVVSTLNRHGKVMGLTSNQECFSFSVCIMDMNVIRTDTVGAPRNFMLVDLDGSWHDGWKTVEFMPNKPENDFLLNHKLWTGNSVVFKNFVHPNRWASFYGKWYFLAKLMIDRLKAEAKWRRSEQVRLLDSGVRFPPSDNNGQPRTLDTPETDTESGTREKVESFECRLEAPWAEPSTFFPIQSTPACLAHNADILRAISYNLLPRLRFTTRATELAFHNDITHPEREPHSMPSWMNSNRWIPDYVIPGKRIKWSRFELAPGYAYLIRWYQSSQQVRA